MNRHVPAPRRSFCKNSGSILVKNDPIAVTQKFYSIVSIDATHSTDFSHIIPNTATKVNEKF